MTVSNRYAIMKSNKEPFFHTIIGSILPDLFKGELYMASNTFRLFPVTSLEKFFADEPFNPERILDKDMILQGERYSFQAAYCLEKNNQLIKARVVFSGNLAPFITVRQVGLVPSLLPNYPDCDSFVLRKIPGLYPDPLYPLEGTLTLIPGQWRSLWITIPAEASLMAGDYALTVSFVDDSYLEGTENSSLKTCPVDSILGSFTFTLNCLHARLPRQTLLHTQWFHTDCIADWYQVTVFSEAYWNLVEQYMKCAADYGVNLLLTPLFTPPLDTAFGKERTTVQLIDVFCTPQGYQFGMEKLEHWLTLCERCNIPYLEFSHLFTQWGAEHAPKIMAYPCSPQELTQDIQPIRIFGWETDSTEAAYQSFLNSFLPRLMDFIREHQLEERCFFHISDEPHKDHLPVYLKGKELVKRHIEKIPIMDAISDYEYYEQGIVDLPICCNDHIEPFLEHKVPHLWTYYCCAQYKEVPNRFFCMPSLRNRILGIILYRHHLEGFLHWGFNFWNSILSERSVDPYCETDAGCAFPSGDAFLVYPGPNGPIGSLRGEVLMEGLQDMRALMLLEAYTDRETVENVIDESLPAALDFCHYPYEDAWLLNLRSQCYQKIAFHFHEQTD